MLRLNLQYFGHLIQRVDSLEKTLMLGRIGGRVEKKTSGQESSGHEEKEMTEDEMAGWHHQLNGHGFG